jgi:hypothetical protein
MPYTSTFLDSARRIGNWCRQSGQLTRSCTHFTTKAPPDFPPACLKSVQSDRGTHPRILLTVQSDAENSLRQPSVSVGLHHNDNSV